MSYEVNVDSIYWSFVCWIIMKGEDVTLYWNTFRVNSSGSYFFTLVPRAQRMSFFPCVLWPRV